MPKAHVRKGDTVKVLTGKDKKKTGVVESVDVRNQKVVVEGINMVKRHVKPKPPMQPTGSIVEKSAAIHISNVMLVDPATNEPTRTRREENEGKKVRVSVKTGKEV